MGIHGLWKLLSPVGRRISIEMLSGKVIAIDASIWITQFIKAMKDSDGNPMPNAHVIGVFRRLCKLLFHNIKPVFVFDGGAPMLKKREIIRRRLSRNKQEGKVQKTAQRLLLNSMKRQLVGEIQKKRKKTNQDSRPSPFASTFVPASGYDKYISSNSGQDDKDDTSRLEVRDEKDEDQQVIETLLSNSDPNDHSWDDKMQKIFHSETVDAQLITSIPSTMKKDVMDQLMRQRAINHRQNFLPIAQKPSMFCKAQIDNFLKGIQLKAQIEEAGKSQSHLPEGSRMIASEAGKYCILVKKKDEDEHEARKRRKKNPESTTVFGKQQVDEIEWESQSDKEIRHKEDLEIESEGWESEELNHNISTVEPDQILNTSEVEWDEELIYDKTENPANQSKGFVVDIESDEEKQAFANAVLLAASGIENQINCETGDKTRYESLGSDTFEYESDALSDTENEIFRNEMPNADFDSVAPSTDTHNEALSVLEQAMSTAANLTQWATESIRREIARQKKLAIDSSKSPNKKEEIIENTSGTFMENNQELEPVQSSKNSDLTNKDFFESRESDPSSNFFSVENVEKIDDKYDSKSLALETSYAHINPDSFPSTQSTRHENLTNDDFKLDYDLETEAQELRNTLNKQTIASEGMNSEMQEDIKALLKLFGVPYVVSPSEAEAQCAELERLGLVDGVITEDSDSFVFGSRHVYKNVFDQRRYVECYMMDDIEKELGLDRNKLIALALVLGSDYTSGIRGVGIVNAVEIVNAFGSEGLGEFKMWLDAIEDPKKLIEEKGQANYQSKLEFMKKHRGWRTKWMAESTFPDEKVIQAYAAPNVDHSTEPFHWSNPDVPEIRKFLQKLGLEQAKVDEILLPVIRERSERNRQTRLDSYLMSHKDNIRFAHIQSKRINKAITKLRESKAESSSKLENEGARSCTSNSSDEDKDGNAKA